MILHLLIILRSGFQVINQNIALRLISSELQVVQVNSDNSELHVKFAKDL